MHSSLLAALPLPLAHAAQAGQPITLGGEFVGAESQASLGSAHKTPQAGPEAVRRWIDLFDRAIWLIGEPDSTDPRPQRTASKAIDSLFAYEHQLTPHTRRQAREALWQRDWPDDPLPSIPHMADAPRPVGCHCPTCRNEWEQCRCRTCRLARLLNRPESSLSS